MISKKIKVGTDCTGIGSLEQALKNLNIPHSIEFACEIDKFARQTYLANFQSKIMYENIKTRDHNALPDIDLYVAGFPCQDFSIAGKRQGFESENGRGTIFFDVLETLKVKRPGCFILENVKGLLSHNKGETFKTILKLLGQDLGYSIYWKVLNATDYGIPQNRERVFIVGFKDFFPFSFPEKMNLNLKLLDLLEDNPDSKYFLSQTAIDGLIKHRSNNKLKGNGFGANILDKEIISSPTIRARYYKDGSECLIKDLSKYNLSEKALLRIETKNYSDSKFLPDVTGCINSKNNSGQLSIDSGTTLIPNPLETFLRESKKNPQAYRVFKPEVSVCIQSNAGGVGSKTGLYAIPVLTPDRAKKRQNGRRFKEDGEPMFTLTSQDRHGVFDGMNIRRLTPLECFRLFGFPDDFIKPVSETQQYKQAGNSIVVNVFESLLQSIFNVWVLPT